MANVNSQQELLVHLRELCYQATAELLIDSGAPFYHHVSKNILRLEDLTRQLEQSGGGMRQRIERLMFEQGSNAKLGDAIRLGNSLSCCLNCCVQHKYAVCEELSCACCVYGTYAVDVIRAGEQTIRVHAADPDCIETGDYRELRINIDSRGAGRVLGATYKTLSNIEHEVPAGVLDALLRQGSF